MSSSTESSPRRPVVHSPLLRGGAPVTPLQPHDLRDGAWTRLAPGSALGDAVSEETLTTVAEHARDAARAQGYSVGWAQGRREAAEAAAAAAQIEARRHRREEERREAEHLEAVEGLHRAADELRAVIDDVCQRIESQATELAWALSEELVGHELRGAQTSDVVARVLALRPTGQLARVRLHPDHVDDPALVPLVAEGVRCIGDPSLGRLDALVHVEDHVFDLRIDTAMERVREVLQ